MKYLLVFLCAALFGGGLAVSGMTDPARVIGFLDLTGAAWDPTLALVMAGALAAFAIGDKLLGCERAPILDAPKRLSLLAALGDRRLLVGGALFGIGWGLVGICPGPALANLLGGHQSVLWFVPAMIGGMLIAQRGFGADGST